MVVVEVLVVIVVVVVFVVVVFVVVTTLTPAFPVSMVYSDFLVFFLPFDNFSERSRKL